MDLIASQIPPEVNLVHFKEHTAASEGPVEDYFDYVRVNGSWYHSAYKSVITNQRLRTKMAQPDEQQFFTNDRGWNTRYMTPEELAQIMADFLTQ